MRRPSLPPLLDEMSALRALGVRRLCLQALLVGGIAGGVIGAFRLLYTLISQTVVDFAAGHAPGQPLAALCAASGLGLLALAAWALLRYEPLISGSGIPQVELAITGRVPMPWARILWSKFVGTLVSLTGGLSVGREGPSIQMGAAVGCWVGRIWHDTSGQSLPRYLIGGSVAGLTAAFGAPLAGMFFAFEEVKALISVPLLLFTALAAAAAWFVVEGLFGFGLVFPFEHMTALRIGQWWLPLLAGLATGCLGALYNELLLRMLAAADRLFSGKLFLRVLAAFALSGLLLYVYPQVLSGFGLEATDLEPLPMSFAALCLLLLVKLFFSCASFASGVAGGLLMPMLLAGAMAGACMASPLLGAGLLDAGQVSCLLILGMAGLFSATVRAPLTGTALILEMSGGWANAPAVLITALVAAYTANFLHSRPVYDRLKDRLAASYESGRELAVNEQAQETDHEKRLSDRTRH